MVDCAVHCDVHPKYNTSTQSFGEKQVWRLLLSKLRDFNFTRCLWIAPDLDGFDAVHYEEGILSCQSQFTCSAPEWNAPQCVLVFPVGLNRGQWFVGMQLDRRSKCTESDMALCLGVYNKTHCHIETLYRLVRTRAALSQCVHNGTTADFTRTRAKTNCVNPDRRTDGKTKNNTNKLQRNVDALYKYERLNKCTVQVNNLSRFISDHLEPFVHNHFKPTNCHFSIKFTRKCWQEANWWQEQDQSPSRS